MFFLRPLKVIIYFFLSLCWTQYCISLVKTFFLGGGGNPITDPECVHLLQDALFNILFNARLGLPVHCMRVSVCVVHACVSVYLPVCSWIKEYSVFLYCRLSPSLTFYCELLGDWQKRSAVQPFMYFPSLPSSVHPSIPTSPFISQPLYPLVSSYLCFCLSSDIKHTLTVL